MDYDVCVHDPIASYYSGYYSAVAAMGLHIGKPSQAIKKRVLYNFIFCILPGQGSQLRIIISDSKDCHSHGRSVLLVLKKTSIRFLAACLGLATAVLLQRPRMVGIRLHKRYRNHRTVSDIRCRILECPRRTADSIKGAI
ncbi:uncharacterized protein F5147DRAFT_426868 [Suillus discolor]|uniref:Uncharacterized protein n=1 Tax=Suillus discolor TaxID=1912936 RepID=A0A9P7EWK2_9AGAM|nr:uncharacterized protein F5147DRAFT_426868 [Suillus discolor]KAG2092639.1 hypothetical protein F5147DRAFT_426868 [Suillus discolor]